MLSLGLCCVTHRRCDAETETGEHAPRLVALVKLSLSVGYIVIMQVRRCAVLVCVWYLHAYGVGTVLMARRVVVYAQLYFILLSNATSKMSEPNAFPRFLFVGQVYYYLFWYRMMATDGETDVLFWGMLFLIVRLRCGLGVCGCVAVWCCQCSQTPCLGLQNVNYIMGSTGAYLDLLRGVVPGHYSSAVPIDWVSGRTAIPPQVAATVSQELFFRMKVAEQDTLADLACLAAVPSITTVLALLGYSHGVIGVGAAAVASSASALVSV